MGAPSTTNCCCAHTASSSGPRCSRNAPSTLLIAPAEPGPEGLPGACQLQLGSETAARTCQRAACGLPATTALPATTSLSRCPLLALSARALLQRPHPCSGLIQSGSSRGCSGVLGLLGLLCVALGGRRNVGGEFEWSTSFEFLAVSALPPTAFRCQLNEQRQSRDPGGPDRTLVCIQPTPSAQAVPSPTKPLPKKWAKITPTATWRPQ